MPTKHPGMSFFHPELPSQPDNPPAAAEPAAPPAATVREEADGLVVAPAPAPAVEPGSTPTADRKFAGKYNTVGDLETGYWEQFRETQRILAENQALKSHQAQSQPQRPDPLSVLEDYGIPPQAVGQAIREVARAEAAAMFETAMAPLAAGVQARGTVMQQFPDFAQREPEIAGFIRSDPVLSQRYDRLSQTDPQAAMEWAYLQHSRVLGQRPRTPAAQPVTPALMPASSSVSERKQPENADGAERLQRAMDYYNVYRDPQPYVRERLKGLIPDSHFTGV